MDNVFDQAVLDFYNGNQQGELLIHNTYGDPDEMPLEVYFRGEEDLTELETLAVAHCHGKVLDLGAGLGSISMILQEKDIEVDALEISSTFCSIMFERKVKSIIETDFLTAPKIASYDTILMLMNGLGICGSLDRLQHLFALLDRNLAPGGQVIFDSSDLSYLYEGEPPVDRYFGEMDFCYEYAGKRGDWFKWLYVDADTLRTEAEKYGFVLDILFTEETDQYLGRLTRI